MIAIIISNTVGESVKFIVSSSTIKGTTSITRAQITIPIIASILASLIAQSFSDQSAKDTAPLIVNKIIVSKTVVDNEFFAPLRKTVIYIESEVVTLGLVY